MGLQGVGKTILWNVREGNLRKIKAGGKGGEHAVSWKMCVFYIDNIGWCKEFRSITEMERVLGNVLHSGLVRRITVEVVRDGGHEGKDC
jgi:hypothetical protein